jgi:hypothetical protein
MKVIVCGGRDYAHDDHVHMVLDQIHDHEPITLLIEGGATGADAAARAWASKRGVPRVTEEADWARYGRKAGPMRNERMLGRYRPEVVVAFPGGRGTADMVTRAKAMQGVRVEEHRLHDPTPPNASVPPGKEGP